MVSGVFIDLHFPYAQFPCKNLTGDILYPLVWEVVQCRESCRFKVLATICHHAWQPQIFTKTVNPYSNDTNHHLYFMIDVPHLMKIARNC